VYILNRPGNASDPLVSLNTTGFGGLVVYGLLPAIVRPNHITGEAGSNVSNAFVRAYGGVNVFIRSPSLCKGLNMLLLLS
jgi:hypothetical protein